MTYIFLICATVMVSTQSFCMKEVVKGNFFSVSEDKEGNRGLEIRSKAYFLSEKETNQIIEKTENPEKFMQLILLRLGSQITDIQGVKKFANLMSVDIQ